MQVNAACMGLFMSLSLGVKELKLKLIDLLPHVNRALDRMKHVGAVVRAACAALANMATLAEVCFVVVVPHVPAAVFAWNCRRD